MTKLYPIGQSTENGNFQCTIMGTALRIVLALGLLRSGTDRYPGEQQHERSHLCLHRAVSASREDSSQASPQPVSIDSASDGLTQEQPHNRGGDSTATMINGSSMSIYSLLLVISAVAVMLIVSAVLMARAMKRRAFIKASFQDPWLGSPTVSYIMPMEECESQPPAAVDPADVESTSERDESQAFRRSQDSSFIRFSGIPWSCDSKSVRSLKASYWTALYNQSQEVPLESHPATEYSIAIVSTSS